jgi:hypothetical protein
VQYPLGEATGGDRGTGRRCDAMTRMSDRCVPRPAARAVRCVPMCSYVFLEDFYPSKRVHNTRDES